MNSNKDLFAATVKKMTRIWCVFSPMAMSESFATAYCRQKGNLNMERTEAQNLVLSLSKESYAEGVDGPSPEKKANIENLARALG